MAAVMLRKVFRWDAKLQPRSIPLNIVTIEATSSTSHHHFSPTTSTSPNAFTIATSIGFAESSTLASKDQTSLFTTRHATASSATLISRIKTHSPETFATVTPSAYHNGSTAAGLHTHSYTDLSSAAAATYTSSAGNHSHHSGMSTGALVAAILLPILAVIALFLLALLLLRRKPQQSRERSDSGSASFLPVLKEKWGSLRSSLSSNGDMHGMTETGRGPMVMGMDNNAYFTGLDTSSHGGSSPGASGSSATERRSLGGTTFMAPPPPYNRSREQMDPAAPALPQLADFSGMNLEMSQLDGGIPDAPPSAHTRQPQPTNEPITSYSHGISNAALLAIPLDPPRPSSRSAQSFTSTLYSDTASVHSAKAARRSVGPQVITPVASGAGEQRHGSTGDPFNDPNTPVASLSSQNAG